MIKTIFHKALRISRGLALAVGAVVISAVVLGAATTALAAAPGDPFRLGKVNAVNSFTKLVGKASSPRLVIDNNGNGVALRLLVEPGKPPMQVNSTRKVARLNADRLDNLDQSAFLRTDGKAADADKLDGYHASDFLTIVTYGQAASATGPGGPNQNSAASVSCPSGDIALSGGYYGIDPGTQVRGSFPNGPGTWTVVWSNDATVDSVTATIQCSQTRQ
ncbi:hypothetical protein BH20ACT11_BH20ACT11_15360 [soil metagenome]|jgi:hypothetical protein